MSSFDEKIRVATNEKKDEIEKATEEKNAAREKMIKERAEEVRTDMFNKLTAKYHDTIKRGICNEAKKGKNVKYINFARDDFKANCQGLGFPQQLKTNWLNEMCNPESEFLPTAKEDDEWWSAGDKMHFQGVTFDVWNNKAFTVVFKW